MMTLYTLFMFLLVAGGFLYGYKMGADNTAAKYAEKLNAETKVDTDLIAYDQDHLVTFYYTVFSPFRSFQIAWFSNYESIRQKQKSIDDLLALSSQAGDAVEQLTRLRVPSSSPLLVSAQSSYLKSLTLFQQLLNDFRSNEGESSAAALKRLQQSAELGVAIDYALQAQRDYFLAIVKWNQQELETPVSGVNEIGGDKIGIALWKQMNLNVKNAVSANYLWKNKLFGLYMPQDLTVGVEELREAGTSAKLSTVQDAMKSLLDNNAVRKGDFIRKRSIYFDNEFLPGVLFFKRDV